MARHPGTVRMAERLASLADSANPLEDEQLNRERIRHFTETELPADPASMVLRQGLIAQELLNAGLTAPAVEQFMLIRDLVTSAGREPVPGFLATLDELIGVGLLRRGLEQACPAAADPPFPCWNAVPPVPGDPMPDSARATLGRAVRWHEAQLERRPGDLRARWMLTLSAMAAGEWEDTGQGGAQIPASDFEGEGVLPRFEEVAGDVGLDVVSVSGGGIVDDFTGDRLPDVMVSSRGLRDPLRYFENDGTGHFVDRTEQAGLTGLNGGLNLVHADYDNDGDIDVLVLRGGWLVQGWPNSLLRNDGDGSFSDVTEEAGLYSEHPTQTAAWADYDGDGWLDLFIGNESRDGRSHTSELYRNLGDGRFEEVAAVTGLDVNAFVKGVAWGDVDDDGRPDLYVSTIGAPNRLYRNAGPQSAGGWRFDEITEAAGVAEPRASFPTWFWDFDNDGRLDLFVAGYSAQTAHVAAEALGIDHGLEQGPELPRIYRNGGDGTFEDVTETVGLNRIMYAMGSNFGDLDNDGWLDVFVGTGDPDFRQLMPNRVFRNRGDRFEEVTASGGFGLLDKGHGVSFVDIDNDGDQDIHVVLGGANQGDRSRNVLYRNPGFGNDWITLELEGRTANRTGLGARITIELRTAGGPRRIHRSAGTGGSFGANALRQEIGLGPDATIESIEIRWPGSGTVDSIPAIAPNAAYRVVEGSGRAEAVAGPEPGSGR
ncbi:MAG: CRTAC1 family protein [Gemmatimonadota bacterium]|nr:CRTAC1 family protein [Gemmatimonadota bacterium]